MPVGTTASGGEISRLMLALKSIVASRMQLPSLIFDEVDTGVSGDIAVRMAQMMAAMASGMQVITITHLPGVAAMGRRHFKVFKQDNENSTTTRVRQLAPKSVKRKSLLCSAATVPAKHRWVRRVPCLRRLKVHQINNRYGQQSIHIRNTSGNRSHRERTLHR